MGGGTDAIPPLPPVGDSNQSQKSSKKIKSKKQELTLYDKVFGVTKKRKKQEAEEARNLLNFYDNFEKDLRKALKNLLVDDVEQRSWLNLWVKIDPRRTNMMGFSSFCEVFSMNNKCIWSKRVYEIMNSNYTSGVSFTEFVNFCSKFLVLDVKSLHAFTFRLLSRRGTSDDKTILDMQDMKTYLKFKFKKTLKKANFDKLSLEVLKVVEQIPDYGIRQEDIAAYAAKNPSIIAFANGFLTHLRMCVFGYFFWVDRSQQLKKKSSSGISSIGFLKNANIESQRLISSLHKIHGIKTRVPKQFRPKKKKIFQSEENPETVGAGVPLEIKISKSKSTDSKEHPSPGKGHRRTKISASQSNDSMDSCGERSPLPPHKKVMGIGGKKPKSKKKKEGKKKEAKAPKSIVSAAKQSIDPNLFKMDDELIIGGIDDIAEEDDLIKDDLSSLGPGGVEAALDNNIPLLEEDSLEGSHGERLPEICQTNSQKDLKGPEEVKEDVQKEDTTGDVPVIEHQNIERQSSGPLLIARQLSRQMSWISRQGSWLSRQDSAKVEEEPDEETSEEKAARIASLRYYPIGFNIDQLLNTTFEKDFPDIIASRVKAKNDKIAQMRDKLKIDLIAEQRTYNLMTQVLDDLVHQKRGKRLAFGRWLDVVGMLECSNNTNYRIQFKPVATEEAKMAEVKETKDLNEKKEETGKKFGFGMFGKGKKKKAEAEAAKAEEQEERKKQEENKKKTVGWVTFSDDENDDDKPDLDSLDGGNDDMEYELHRKIIRMTSSIQESGVDDTAFNEYMEEYKAKCVVLQPDRTKIIERESADFMITLKQCTEDTAKKVVVYGPGVEYIAQKLYLPQNQSDHACLENGPN